METEIGGSRVSVAKAATVESATVVAVTVTVCWEAMEFGAVYRPDGLTAPAPTGVTDQTTPRLQLPVTVG